MFLDVQAGCLLLCCGCASCFGVAGRSVWVVALVLLLRIVFLSFSNCRQVVCLGAVAALGEYVFLVVQAGCLLRFCCCAW